MPRTALFSHESIQAQTDDFGSRLETLISQITTDIETGVLDRSAIGNHPALQAMCGVIEHRTGLKVHFITNENLAAILPFYSNKSHIFILEMFRGQFNIATQESLLKTFDKKKGTVNLDKATVDGIFSEYDHPVYLNLYELSATYKLTPAEIAACLLHELGHGFNACYFSDRTDRTNQVLARITRKLQDRSEKGDVEYVFRELQSVNKDITKEEVDKLLNGPRVVAGAVWFRAVHQMVRSILDDDKYSDTAFEQQSDAFAARFGYGRHLTTGLDKLTGTSAENNGALLFLAETIDLIVTLGLAMIALAAITAGGFVPAFFCTMMFSLVFRMHGEDVKDYTYDNLKSRYLRIRQDLVDQLKTMKSDRQAIQKTLEAIYDIDALIKEARVINSLPTKLVNAIYSAAGKAQQSIADQQLMEALASNDLFVNAAELRTLA